MTAPTIDSSYKTATELFESKEKFMIEGFLEFFLKNIDGYLMLKAEGRVQVEKFFSNFSNNTENRVIISRCSLVQKYEILNNWSPDSYYLLPKKLYSHLAELEVGFLNPFKKRFQELFDLSIEHGLTKIWEDFFKLKKYRITRKSFDKEDEDILKWKEIKIIFYQLGVGLSLATFQAEDDCKLKLKAFKLHPLYCCTYPVLIDNSPEISYKCTKLCKALPNPPFHCLRNCYIVQSGVIHYGKFNASAIVNIMFEDDKSSDIAKPLSDQWKNVVLKSAEKCKKEVIFDDNRIKDDDFNFVYTKFTECVRKENFVNCPTMVETETCVNIKDIIEKYCGASNYDFLHEFFFEDFYYKNLSRG